MLVPRKAHVCVCVFPSQKVAPWNRKFDQTTVKVRLRRVGSTAVPGQSLSGLGKTARAQRRRAMRKNCKSRKINPGVPQSTTSGRKSILGKARIEPHAVHACLVQMADMRHARDFMPAPSHRSLDALLLGHCQRHPQGLGPSWPFTRVLKTQLALGGHWLICHCSQLRSILRVIQLPTNLKPKWCVCVMAVGRTP